MKTLFVKIILCFAISTAHSVQKQKRDKSVDDDEGKSSLVFVFDTTASMSNDLRQLREGAEMIMKTALEESNIIADFVFVPFHDPSEYLNMFIIYMYFYIINTFTNIDIINYNMYVISASTFMEISHVS